MTADSLVADQQQTLDRATSLIVLSETILPSETLDAVTDFYKVQLEERQTQAKAALKQLDDELAYVSNSKSV